VLPAGIGANDVANSFSNIIASGTISHKTAVVIGVYLAAFLLGKVCHTDTTPPAYRRGENSHAYNLDPSVVIRVLKSPAGSMVLTGLGEACSLLFSGSWGCVVV
jgi:hypothetical protein